ncbi:hypothetical protein ACFYVR_07610 [Rhodococcus sp. NPDC003318]|uniref:hypothetical protein n=1 Tax=Rhodococcus sp. NPDC003318 TaxID=3364503 RepID=UPI0036BB5022
MLDLDVSEPTSQVTDVADWRSGLLPAPTRKSAGSAMSGRTVRSSARLLYVIGSVYDRLGFDVVDVGVFDDLVIARIVEPTSKVDSLRVLDDLGVKALYCKTIQCNLTRAQSGEYRDLIAKVVF